MSLLDRLVMRTEVDDDCWRWTAQIDARGYGRIQVAGTSKLAHRMMYESVVGPIPEGLELDHVCRNRGCVNPDHLEPVTHQENIARSPTVGRWGSRRTHCLSGHELNAENTWLRKGPKGLSRQCRVCDRLRKAAKRAAR